LNQSIAVVIAATFLFCAIAFVTAFLVWRYVAEKNQRERERDEILRRLVPALEKFTASVEPFSQLPVLLNGLVGVCKAQVAEIAKFRAASQVIAGVLGNRTPEDRKDDLIVATEEDAYRAGRKQELMQRGIPPDEVQSQMDIEDQQRIFGGGDPSVLGSIMEN
jgi:hypothetical protein